MLSGPGLKVIRGRGIRDQRIQPHAGGTGQFLGFLVAVVLGQVYNRDFTQSGEG